MIPFCLRVRAYDPAYLSHTASCGPPRAVRPHLIPSDTERLTHDVTYDPHM